MSRKSRTINPDPNLLKRTLRYDPEKRGFVEETTSNGLPFLMYDCPIKFDSQIYHGISIFSELVSKDSYVGQNAYGAKKDIAAAVRKEWTIFPTNGCSLKLPKSADSLKYEDLFFQYKPENAKKDAGVIALLYLFRIAEPYIGHDVTKSTPKMDNPYDITTTHMRIYGNLVGVWLYNKNTGVVIKKIQTM